MVSLCFFYRTFFNFPVEDDAKSFGVSNFLILVHLREESSDSNSVPSKFILPSPMFNMLPLLPEVVVFPISGEAQRSN